MGGDLSRMNVEAKAAVASRETKLVIDRISKQYQSDANAVTVLENVSLKVNAGEFYTLIGHSGCGKSTLLNIVAGLIEASSGRIVVDGAEQRAAGPDRGMVFQSYTLFPWLNIMDNVAFGPRIRGASVAEQRDIAIHYLELVKLPGVHKAYPKELSGGMRQRVALARALANKPSILLMDEPFGALDAETREDMQNLLLSIREKEFMTVLFITHDLDEAVLLSERIGMMTSRPGVLAEEISVPLPYPRNIDVKLSENFLEIKRQLVERFRFLKKESE